MFFGLLVFWSFGLLVFVVCGAFCLAAIAVLVYLFWVDADAKGVVLCAVILFGFLAGLGLYTALNHQDQKSHIQADEKGLK
jgi:hypothetical protein